MPFFHRGVSHITTTQRGTIREIRCLVLPVGLVLAGAVTAPGVTCEPLVCVEVMEFAQDHWAVSLGGGE